MTRAFAKLIQFSAAIASLLCGISGARGESAADVIDGVLARDSVIASGRLEYSYHGRTRGSPPFDQKTVYAFEGENWAQYSPAGFGKTINHGGYLLEFSFTPQPDGRMQYSAAMQPPKGLSSRGETNRPPVFAGTLWFQSEVDYLTKNRGRARSAGTKSIDGVETKQIDVDVPAPDWRIFHLLSPQLKDGGILRLFVAPSLGYAIPRYEHVDPRELIVVWFDAHDFHEQAPGVFFPNRISRGQLDAKGEQEFELWYDIKSSFINQPVPPEEFEVDIPLGTSVHDARDPAHVTAFFVNRKSPSKALAELSDRVRGVSRTNYGRTVALVVIGVLGGVAVAIAVLFAYRRLYA